MLCNNNKTPEPSRIESIRLSARRNKLIVTLLTLVVFAIAVAWTWVSTRRFQEQTTKTNQEHLLDIVRAETELLKHLLSTNEEHSVAVLTRDITIGEKGYIWVIDGNGVLLSHPDDVQIGNEIIAIRKAAFPDSDWSELAHVVERMKNGEEGVGIYHSIWWAKTNWKMSEKLVGFTPVQIGNRTLSLAACMGFDEIARPIRNHTLRTFAVASLVALLFVATGTAFYLSQKKENNALQDEVTEHEKTKEALQRSHDMLGHRVKERTAELERTNDQLRVEFEERKLAEEKSRELAKFPSENPNPVLRVSEDGTVTYANNAGESLLRHVRTGLRQRLPSEWCQILQDVISSRSNKQTEVEYDGHTFSLTFAPIMDSGYVNIYGLDITELKCLEQQILRVNDEVQGSIGRDLHDGLLQQLTGITFFCDTLTEKLTKVSSSRTADACEISKHLREVMTWLRDLAKGLYPVDLDKNGLATALETLASTTSHLFHTSVVFEHSEPITISNPQAALHLYRIAQEAVNNAVKHGNAKHICISLARSRKTTTLAVRDNGSGFSQKESTEGIGLQSIYFRAKAIGGIIDIQSSNGKGTVVSCSFPERCKV